MNNIPTLHQLKPTVSQEWKAQKGGAVSSTQLKSNKQDPATVRNAASPLARFSQPQLAPVKQLPL